MFSCFIHGWSSRVELCPKCNPVVYSTSNSSGAEFQDSLENPRLEKYKDQIKELKKKLLISEGALRKIVSNDPVVLNGAIAWNYKMIARDALQEMEK